jgi:hypothetical protein
MVKGGTPIPRRDFLIAGAGSLVGLSAGPSLANGKDISNAQGATDPVVALSWEEQVNLRRLQPVRAEVDGIPVYGFGDTFVYGVSPDLLKGGGLQEGNNAEVHKIQPKKSWEIGSNKMGATAPRLPRTELNDTQVFLGVHLIDGDPETCWMSRGQSQADVEQVWIRIDLAAETRVKSVVLVPRDDSKVLNFSTDYQRVPGFDRAYGGMPEDFTIQVSRDAWHWETVHENRNYAVPRDTRPREFSFEPRLIKQILITARKCTEVEITLMKFGFCFSLAGVEVIDESGENVALVSRGASVTVSSTTRGFADEKLLHDQLWPVHYDLGLKWVRVAYWDSVLNWHYVEQEKGKFVVDPLADQVMTECARNGVNVVLCLAYGNWLYTPQGKRKLAKQIWEVPWEMAPPPNTPEMLEGYKNFVRFMVRHFRERIRHFEIWNEPCNDYAWGNKPNAKEYAQLVKEVAPIIRQEAPQAKILMGGVGWRPGHDKDLKTILEEGVGRLVDVMTIHPFYGMSQASEAYLSYPADVKVWKQLAESHGFRGEYMATETGWYAPYPKSAVKFAAGEFTEMVKAKCLAKFILTSAALDLTAFWNETWQDQFPFWDGTLMRNTFSADPVSPQQPQAAYYVLRTLATVLEGAKPSEIPMEFVSTEKRFDSYAFRLPDESCLVAFWLPGEGIDDFPDVRSDVIISDRNCKNATGIDVLNGTEQALRFSIEGGKTILKGMLIKDYPVVVRLGGA